MRFFFLVLYYLYCCNELEEVCNMYRYERMGDSVYSVLPYGLGFLNKQASKLRGWARLLQLSEKYPTAAVAAATSPFAAFTAWLYGENAKKAARHDLSIAQIRANTSAANRLSYARYFTEEGAGKYDRAPVAAVYGENAARLGRALVDLWNRQLEGVGAGAEDSQEEVAEPLKTTKSGSTSSTTGKKSYRGLGIGAGAGGALGLAAGLALAKDKSLLAKILYGAGGTLVGAGAGAAIGNTIADRLA